MLDYKDTEKLCQLDTKILNTFLEYRALRFQINTDASKKALDIMRRYINQYYKEDPLEEINKSFLERFYSSFLPCHLLRLTYKDIESLSIEWAMFSDFISNSYHITSLKRFCKDVYKDHENELFRILYLIKEVRKYGEVPVLCWEPFIIDMKCYKNMKSKENAFAKYIVYDQGYFKIEDKLGNNIIFIKNSPVKTYYKIKIDVPVGEEMKIGDIIHMSIKRKVFSTAWNMVNVKAYFDQSAGEYLNLGGNKDEASKNS
ncbi:MAG: hypothetical protein CVU84_15410 [Firmicutes bacterium HGW-Firmicutes-1]|jgi:hypothetical protein|nr:MAG: hypothetical protein CVU84_15410 [Firmicutes bacterium HGW-Firmicutes-1]